jgi:CBS domain-containing membrane protein
MQQHWQTFKNFIGFSFNRSTHREKLISGLGGFIGILLILLVTQHFVALNDAGLIVASMGASAVLLFAVPHGPLSQPWPLIGGHVTAAIIGVSCYQLIPNYFIAAAAAVGLAIIGMYYLRCIHPPGGATALSAVAGGSSVHALGYGYVLTPVLINVLVIFIVAVAFNFLFYWRRYPAVLMDYAHKAHAVESNAAIPADASLNRDDLEYAMRQMNMYIDVSDDDLEKIYQLARNRHQGKLTAQDIKLGHAYSNGEYGSDWSVRQVVDESDKKNPARDLIIYKVVAGKDRRNSGTLSREDFTRWAKYEVYLNESSWQRVAPASTSTGTDKTTPGNKI